MLFFSFIIATVLLSQATWAFPQQTTFGNATTRGPSGPTPTGCLANCTLSVESASYLYWVPLPVATTITAETVVFIINNKLNTTRTTTLTIAETELGNYTLPDVNTAGTHVTTLTNFDPLNGQNQTTVVAYPTVYSDYAYTIDWSGQITTTTDGQATCLTHNGYLPETLPSHPPLPTSRNPLDTNDTKGLTYEPQILYNGCDPNAEIGPLFPDNAALHTCNFSADCVAPLAVSSTALFLTATSTSFDDSSPPEQTSAAGPSSAPGQPTALPESLPSPPTSPSQSAAPVNTQPAPPNPPTTTIPPANNPPPNNSPPNNPPANNPPANNPPANNPPANNPPMNNPPGNSNQPGAGPTAPGSQATSPAPLPAPIVVAGNTIAPNSASQFIVSGQTLAPGSPIVLGTGAVATTVALQASAGVTQLIVGSSTSNLPPPAVAPAVTAPPVVVGASIISANSASQYVVGSQTLALGSSIVIGSGTATTALALQTNSNGRTEIVVGTSTSLLPLGGTGGASALPALTIAGQTITANPAGQFIVSGQTLAPGSTITLGSGASATPVVLQTNSNGQTQLVVGTSTSTLPSATAALGSGIPALTLGGQTISENSASQFVIGGTTLTPGGPAVTIGGTPVSLAPGGTAVVVGTSTEALGSFIASGVGATGSPGAGGNAFTGAATSLKPIEYGWVGAWTGLWAVAGFLLLLT
ncbi:hypothetical protein MMC09_004293 [Bachmanniomyces sp. S44760]|nr:hypothetical protein [Bachmanniomyces sp. S44760]